MIFDYYVERARNNCRVVSTHKSKSTNLPVYKIKKNGLEIILRGNYYDWKVSIKNETSIILPDMKIDTSKKINSVYCEGFKDSWVYDSYDNDDKQFTIELPYNEYKVYYFFKRIIELNSI